MKFPFVYSKGWTWREFTEVPENIIVVKYVSDFTL